VERSGTLGKGPQENTEPRRGGRDDKFFTRKKNDNPSCRPYGAQDHFRGNLPRVPASSAVADSASTLGYFLVAPTALVFRRLWRFRLLETGK
jgi:hypothetical protein